MSQTSKDQPQPKSRRPRIPQDKATVVGIIFTVPAAFLTYKVVPTLVLKFGDYGLFLLALCLTIPWLRYLITNPFPGGMSVAELNDVLIWPVGFLIRKYWYSPSKRLNPKRSREKEVVEPAVISEVAAHCIALVAAIPIAGMLVLSVIIEGQMAALVGAFVLIVWIDGFTIRFWMFKPWRNSMAVEEFWLAATWEISPWIRPHDSDGISW